MAAPLLAGSLNFWVSLMEHHAAVPSSSEALGAAIVACLCLTKSLAFTGSPSMTLLKGETICQITSRSAVHTCRCRKLDVYTSVLVQQCDT